MYQCRMKMWFISTSITILKKEIMQCFQTKTTHLGLQIPVVFNQLEIGERSAFPLRNSYCLQRIERPVLV